MEKQESSMPTSRSELGPTPSAPPPSLPPSYEEAIASSVRTTNINITQYTTTSPRVSSPVSYVQSTVSRSGHMESGASQYVPPPAYSINSEIRVIRGQRTYNLAPTAVKMQCPSCSAEIKTSIVSDHQPMAHFCCLILCILGCCLCSCLPYFLSAFMTVHHFCPRCKVYIGTWKGFEPSRQLVAV